MSDVLNSNGAPDGPTGLWPAIKKAANRLQDWFVIQPVAVKLMVLAMAVLIPATGIYSFMLMQKQAAVAEQVKAMAAAGRRARALWTLNDKLPVVFGTGSVLSFLETNPVERITVIYKPLMWNVSERIILIESQGKQYAYYPSDMETKIFADKAVTAPWGGKLAFVPRAELSASSLELLERLDQRFAGARPQSEKDGWKAGVSGVLSAALTLGLLGFLSFQLKGQFKSLKFIEPAQVHGSIDDLVGMDDIKAEVRADQGPVPAPRRVCRVRHQQAVQRDVQRPGGHRQDQAGQLPGQGTEPAHPVPLRGQPGNRLRGRRLEHAQPHRGHGQAAQALHRVPGRGAGPVHEARRPPQVRRRHRRTRCCPCWTACAARTTPRSSGSWPATSTAKPCRWTRPCCAASR